MQVLCRHALLRCCAVGELFWCGSVTWGDVLVKKCSVRFWWGKVLFCLGEEMQGVVVFCIGVVV